MKISVNRLRQLVDTALPTEGIAEALTMAGLEVEEIQPVAPAFTGVRIAEVIDVATHPDAAKLKVCRVNIGDSEPLQIVCGASNVRAGIKVPCATVGARLPGLEIKTARLRGVESFGMLCSASELGLSDEHDGLLELPGSAKVGDDIRTWMDLDDNVLTLKITPNRGDCLSLMGVARDLAAATNSHLTPEAVEVVAPNGAESRVVSIAAPEACGVYFGRVLSGLDPNARSPHWLKRRLERAGLRPISPLVDITNLVMIEMGQPMHAFDQEKLRGSVSVRFAQPGETIRLLNGEDAALDESILLICDDSGPIAVGGVMGGEPTMCTPATTSVFFEAAWFAPGAIRGRAQKLSVNSDAAYRFERGVDPAIAKQAIEWATALVCSICATPSTRIGPVTSATGRLPISVPVEVRPSRADQLIGMHIVPQEQVSALERVGCKVETRGSVFQVTPPSHRFDLSIEEDFIEEIARIHGYAHVPDRTPVSSLPMVSEPSTLLSKSQLKKIVSQMGFFEAINYSFVDPAWETDFCANSNPPRLLNPIASHMSVMRSSLVGGLVAALRNNLLQGESRVKLFEIGRCFLANQANADLQPERVGLIAYGPRYPEQWGEGGQKGDLYDFFTLKGEIEVIFGRRRLEFVEFQHPALHPGRSASIRIDGKSAGVIGELHPKWVQRYELKRAPILAEIELEDVLKLQPRQFNEFSRIQVLRRDLAICLDSNHAIGAVQAEVMSLNLPEVREFSPFDVYRGAGLPAGQKSVAFRVVMQDTERTLTDSDAEAVLARIVKVLGEKFGVTLRK